MGKYINETDVPIGWRYICAALDKDIGEMIDSGKLNSFRVVQMKEKFGELRLYYDAVLSDPKDDTTKKELENIIDAYSYISSYTCISCGAFPVNTIDDGWIFPVCETCYKNINRFPEKSYQDFIIDSPAFSPTMKIKYWKNREACEYSVDVTKQLRRIEEEKRL